jgi:hypothetical protein
MRATRHAATLHSEAPELSSMKELYIAAGILPPPETADEKKPSANQLIFRPIKFVKPSIPPTEWEAMERREFLRNGKDYVEFYRSVEMAENT